MKSLVCIYGGHDSCSLAPCTCYCHEERIDGGQLNRRHYADKRQDKRVKTGQSE